jgi:UDP-N-acetylglucosamine 2-epimerase (non-hydrolysing)
MIDTMLQSVDAARAEAAWRHQGLDERTYLLVTLHRPSLVDDPTLLSETMRALGEVAVSMPVVFPVHPRTRQRLESAGADLPSGVTLTEPLSYREFLSLELGARAVLTDSGGVQEETTVLRVPCFTLRANTERPVTITHGTNTLLGLDPARISEVPTRLERPLPEAQPRLWDGRAGGRAAEAILSTFA